jgi:hypothetical protein
MMGHQAVRTVIGFGAGLTGMLASRRDICADAVFFRQQANHGPKQQSQAGEQSGAGDGHSHQISSLPKEVKRPQLG